MVKLMDYDNANPNKKRPPNKAKRSFNKYNNTGQATSWSEVPPDMLLGILSRLEAAGGALMLGRSRDGDILIMRIYHDGFDSSPIYIRPQSQEGFETLTAIYDELGAMQGLPSWS